MLVLCCVAGTAFAQEKTAPAQPAPNPHPVIITKTVTVSGPLAQPLKGKGVGVVAKRIFQYVNPFAPVEKQESDSGVGTRIERTSWTTLVGWHPGPSTAPIEVTHEPHLVLLSVSGAK